MTKFDADRMSEYTEPVRADLDAFDSRLHDYLRADSPLISSIARHLLKTKGKRIRPAFLFLSARAADCFAAIKRTTLARRSKTTEIRSE